MKSMMFFAGAATLAATVAAGAQAANGAGTGQMDQMNMAKAYVGCLASGPITPPSAPANLRILNGPTSPAPVATVTVTPAPATVVKGATQQLAAATKDAIGNLQRRCDYDQVLFEGAVAPVDRDRGIGNGHDVALRRQELAEPAAHLAGAADDERRASAATSARSDTNALLRGQRAADQQTEHRFGECR